MAMRVAVVGSGQISEIYLKNMIERFPVLDVVGCCSLHGESAKKRAEQFGIRYMTYDEIRESQEIEIVVNLTPTTAHYQIIKDMLLAGKHVYTEKVICATFAQAEEIRELAGRCGRRVGCAPDTFMGAAIQTGAKAIADGLIGDVTSVCAVMNRNAAFGYIPGRFTVQKGGGIGYDMGIYYVTALLSLLGPAQKVSGMILPAGERVVIRPDSPHLGETVYVDNENVMAASILFKSGVMGSLHFNGRSIYPENPVITVMGTDGILYLPDPNQFGGSVRLLRQMSRENRCPKEEELPLLLDYRDNSRGVGVADMAQAILEGRPHRASLEMGVHGLELISLVEESSKTGREQELTTTFVPV